jgi:hypothetical protein
MSTIQSVTAIRVDDSPCCIEILAAGIDRTMPEHAALLGMPAVAADEALVTLDLETAQSLRAKLDAAIQALAASLVPVGAG